MRAMFAQFFASFTMLFAMLEKFATAGFHISVATEQLAKGYADEISLDNAAKLKQLKSAANATTTK